MSTTHQPEPEASDTSPEARMQALSRASFLKMGASLLLGALGFGYRGPERRNRTPVRTPEPRPARRYTDNVVPLFPDRRAPRPELGPLA